MRDSPPLPQHVRLPQLADHGQRWRISPVLCRYEQMLIPIADRIGETLYREQNLLFLSKHYNPAHAMLSLLENLDGSGRGRS